MTPPPSLSSLLGQGPKIETTEFWNVLKNIIPLESSWSGKLTAKGKQTLLSAIRFAVSTMEKTDYIDTIINLIEGISQNSGFCQNFSHSDGQFYAGFSTMLTSVLGNSSEAIRQIALVGSISKLYDASQIFRSNTGAAASKALVNVVKTRREPSSLISRSINVIFGLVDLPEVVEIVKDSSNELFTAMKDSPFPRIKLQIIELFWRLHLPMGDVSLDGTESQFFISVAHKIISQNAGSVHVLPFVSLLLPSGQLDVSGWIDIGQDDLIVCHGESISVLPFDSIGGLDADGLEISFEVDSPIPQLNLDKGSLMTVRLTSEIADSVLSDIFSRISRGESQQVDVPEVIEEQISVNEDILPKKTLKSSIALYVPIENKKKSIAETDNSLFDGHSEDISEAESDIPPPAIELGDNIVIEEAPSPPLPEIVAPIERQVTIVAKPSEKSGISDKMEQVSKCLSSGLNEMTKSRLDSLDQFASTLNRQVGSFKDDIRMSIRDKEHGSLKLLESSKSRFQTNIQQFKKKEASIHQTLLGYETESKQIGQRLSAIQKGIRETIQQNRVSLEEELNRLRKQIRTQNSFVNEPFDDDNF